MQNPPTNHYLIRCATAVDVTIWRKKKKTWQEK